MTSQSLRSDTPAGSRLDWLLDDLVARVAHLRQAVILSRDGLALGASSALGRQDAEHLAALAAGLQSLASGGAQHFSGGRVQQTMIEMERGFLVVSAAGEGSCLAVLASREADVGLIAYEMARVVKQMGLHMGVGGHPVAGPGEGR